MSLFQIGRSLGRGLARAAKTATVATVAVQTVPKTPTLICSSGGSAAKQLWLSFIWQRSYSNTVVTNKNLFRKSKFSFLAFACFCLAEDRKDEEKKASVTDLFDLVSSNLDQILKEDRKSIPAFPKSFSEYEIGDRLGAASSNAAVYSANYQGDEVALKILFNYSVPSNENAIMTAFEREHKVLPSHCEDIALQEVRGEEVVLTEHPNIIKLHGKFVDDMPLLHDSIESYPIAVPRAIHSEGFGRNKTLCLVMPKFTCSLREFLPSFTPSLPQKVSMFHQILDGVAHLEKHGIAHRDLKSDNILVNVHENIALHGHVHVVITDFGCCLFGQENMQLPYPTPYTDKGGNIALLAPEIATAVCGEGVQLDYSKADAWTCGTLAYEIFTHDNPFYNVLSNIHYKDEDVKAIPIPLHCGNTLLNEVVVGLLRRDRDVRLSAVNASNILSLMLSAHADWLLYPYRVKEVEVEAWLLESAINVYCQCKMMLDDGDARFLPADVQSKLMFLSGVGVPEVMETLQLICELQAEM